MKTRAFAPVHQTEHQAAHAKVTQRQPVTPSPVNDLLSLQRAVGNRAVQRLLSGAVLQRKCACGGAAGMDGECAECRKKRFMIQPSPIQARLTIGPPGDRYEQEADRMAEIVMRMTQARVQASLETTSSSSSPAAFGRNYEDVIPGLPHGKPVSKQITPLLQRQVEPEEDEEEQLVQANQAHGGSPTATGALAHRIQSLRRGGQQLPGSTRDFFESRFGYDFSRVRVHTGAPAAEIAESINASAFTVGSDVVFGWGKYAPETGQGRQLLAHELTHVIQQETAGMSSTDLRIARQESPGKQSSGDKSLATVRFEALHGMMRVVKDHPKKKDREVPLKELFVDILCKSKADCSSENAKGLRLDLTEGAKGKRGPEAKTVALYFSNKKNFPTSTQEKMLRLLKELAGGMTPGDAPKSLKLTIKNDTYVGKGEDKKPQFHVAVPALLDPKHYALVQYMRGSARKFYASDGTIHQAEVNAKVLGKWVPWEFDDWVMDSPDDDPVYWSDLSKDRWNYKPTSTGFYADDWPLQYSTEKRFWLRNYSYVAHVEFKVSLYDLNRVPTPLATSTYITDPYDEKFWEFSVCKDSDGKKVIHPGKGEHEAKCYEPEQP